MEIRTFDQITDAMRNYIVAHQDKLTDFNEGSVLSSFDEATARELAMLYIRCRVGFSTYLRNLPYSIFNFKRKTGQKATAAVVFSRTKPFGYETRIPKGTVIKAGALKFLTTDIGVIDPDVLNSNEVHVIAEEVGADYNVNQEAIKTIESVLQSDVTLVRNGAPATGGVDGEDWAAFIDRFSEYILGLQRTNGSGLRTGLTESYLIRSMEIIEHFPPEEGLYNYTIYLEDGSGGITPEAIGKAKSIVDGDGSPANGGFRAPGINVRYLPPTQVPVSIVVERLVTRGVEEGIASKDAENAIREYINSLKIGKSVLISDIIIVLKRISYVKDVKITQSSIPIDLFQIARYASCDITVVVQ
ncbi:hypothetical protein FACS189447_03440 [Spirochaetia bacterium]|nr:hypothetical protein FACS189447_03440 [Spirochaetia bacterium]